jgi:hypothetical protein
VYSYKFFSSCTITPCMTDDFGVSTSANLTSLQIVVLENKAFKEWLDLKAGFRSIRPQSRLRMSGSIETDSSPSTALSFETISPHPVAMGSLIVEFFHAQGNGLDPSGLQFCVRCRIGTKAFREKQKWYSWCFFA